MMGHRFPYRHKGSCTPAVGTSSFGGTRAGGWGMHPGLALAFIFGTGCVKGLSAVLRLTLCLPAPPSGLRRGGPAVSARSIMSDTTLAPGRPAGSSPRVQMLACTSLERGFCDLEGPELATGSASFFRSHTLLLDAVCCPNTCKKSARSSGTPILWRALGSCPPPPIHVTGRPPRPPSSWSSFCELDVHVVAPTSLWGARARRSFFASFSLWAPLPWREQRARLASWSLCAR
mmetsp:Transcript_17340/g.33118  ORF Transcript_17340/g.33118 Transcript_17340/m.33118 type:complete len:232 (+) Transcript_17340:1899-2594(+)